VCLVESLIIAGLLASRATVTVAAPGQSQEASTSVATSAGTTPAPAASVPPAPRQSTPPPSTDAKPAPAPPPVTLTRGWLTVETPFEMQIFEENTLLGTTRSERLSLLAGPHELRLVNTSLNFETTINVEIPPGVGITTRIPTPNGTLSLNAVPWANVSLDGRSLGTTPLMNLSVPVGSHEITWRHPQLGERRQTVVVTARGPVSVVRDLRR
jgi:serine/threonine-protein kinase